jgi:hypothetical protein
VFFTDGQLPARLSPFTEAATTYLLLLRTPS